MNVGKCAKCGEWIGRFKHHTCFHANGLVYSCSRGIDDPAIRAKQPWYVRLVYALGWFDHDDY